MFLQTLGRRVFAQHKGYAAIALLAFSCQFNTTALAAEPRTGHDLDTAPRAVAGADHVSLSLPSGAKQCPGSGPSASCSTAPITVAPGSASLPEGVTACALDTDKPAVVAPAACDDTLLDAPQAAPGELPNLVGSAPIQPSVPPESLGVKDFAFQRVRLTSDRSVLAAGQNAQLIATASATVSGTRLAIEIFDTTTGTLVGACLRSSRCIVDYSAVSGTHSFTAFVTPPTPNVPTPATSASSESVRVSWLDVKVRAESPVIGPGRSITFAADATVDVGALGYVLGFYDRTDGKALTHCSRGTSCSTAMLETTAGRHAITAYIGTAAATSTPAFSAESQSVIATWLGVTLEAGSTYPKAGGTLSLTARSNVDLSDTPWSLGIYDQHGRLVDQPCKSGDSCTAQVTVPAGTPPDFTAVIGSAVAPVQSATPVGQIMNRVLQLSTLQNIQARSTAVRPPQTLWGVDSCKPFTSDGNAAGGLYPQVVRGLKGAPDFWGRYITTTYNCPGISPAEIAAASNRNVGLLPIYNDYDCSAVAGYGTGKAYAAAATTAAAAIGIPAGTVIVIDIEPPGPWCSGAIDAMFVRGWHDGVMAAKYAPGYYGDSTVGSTFNRAWCMAVAGSSIAADSYVWSFQPSLSGRFNRPNAPGWAPHSLGCPGRVVAWQYVLSSGANPDVDQDEAISTLPIWYP